MKTTSTILLMIVRYFLLASSIFRLTTSYCVDLPWAPSHTSLNNEQYALLLAELNVTVEACADFAKHPKLCDTLGDNLVGSSLMYASEACCLCGGGRNASSGLQCHDVQNWVDPFGRNCDFYATDRDSVERWALNNYSCLNVLDKPSGNDECCVCGGGFEGDEDNIPSGPPATTSSPTFPIAFHNENCADIRSWHDSFTAEGCPWYARALADIFPNDAEMIEATENNITACDLFSERGYSNGYSAMNACCVCSSGPELDYKLGGVLLDKVFFAEVTDPQLRKYEPYDACIDNYNWKNFGLGCSDMTRNEGKPGPVCERYGDIPNENGTTASQACCTCGGGYSGVNLGRQFRVGFAYMGDEVQTYQFGEIPYTNFIDTTNGAKDGSFVEFMRHMARIGGFGYYEDSISQVSVADYASDPYFACLNDVSLFLIDFCMALYQNTNTYSHLKKSNALFVDEFYLVVPTKPYSLLYRLLTPFRPFTWLAWSAIILLVLYMSFAIKVIQSGELCCNGSGVFSSSMDVVFYATTSFTSGAVDNASENPKRAEKIVIAGFALFCLIVLTAYTATAAAALVMNSPVMFTSFNDVLRESGVSLCIQRSLYDEFLLSWPAAKDILQPRNASTMELVRFLESNDDVEMCHAVVVSSLAYDAAVSRDNSMCDKSQVLLDEVLLSVENVMYVSSSLNSDADDLIELINQQVETGIFSSLQLQYEDLYYEDFNLKRCVSEREPEGTFVRLHINELVSAFTLTFVCTSMGLILYHRKRSVQLRIKQRLGRKLTDDERDFLLLHYLQSLSSKELIEMCELTKSKEVVSAVNMLPDKTGLVRLCYESQRSSYSQDYSKIYEAFGIYDLRQMIYSYKSNAEWNEGSENQGEIDLVTFDWDENNPKDSLVKQILSDTDLRETALQLANEQQVADLDITTSDLYDNEQRDLLYK